VLIWVIYKVPRLEEDDLKTFSDKYGTFFIEFDSKEVSHLLFYCLYIIRRTGLVLLVLCSPDGHLTLICSCTFSVTLGVYIIITMPFENLMYNLYNLFNEILICALHVTIFCYFIPEVRLNPDTASSYCINFITGAWLLNIACSIIAPVYKFIAKFIEKRRSFQVAYSFRPHNEEIDNFKETNKDVEAIEDNYKETSRDLEVSNHNINHPRTAPIKEVEV
jgi:hypothetical protein